MVAINCWHNRFVPQLDLAQDNTRRILRGGVWSIRVCDNRWLESPFPAHILPNAQLLLWGKPSRRLHLLAKCWVLPDPTHFPPGGFLPCILGCPFHAA